MNQYFLYLPDMIIKAQQKKSEDINKNEFIIDQQLIYVKF
jgi:hypothetical protein